MPYRVEYIVQNIVRNEIVATEEAASLEEANALAAKAFEIGTVDVVDVRGPDSKLVFKHLRAFSMG